MGFSGADVPRSVTTELEERDLVKEFKEVEDAAPEIVSLGSIGGLAWWGWRQDLRYAIRALRASPIFAVVCIASLALGIGANTAIFQLLDAIRIRMLPVKNPQELAMIRMTNLSRSGHGAGNFANMTMGLWRQVKEHQEGFSEVFAFANGGGARFAHGMWVSGEFFDVLGVQPVLGRVLHESDDHAGCGAVGAVISYPFWQRNQSSGQESTTGRLGRKRT
jgi:hypothetical protein